MNVFPLQEYRALRDLAAIAAQAHAVAQEEGETMRRLDHTAEEYQRLLAEAAMQEGYDVIMLDDGVYMRVTFTDESGAESITEVNITRFAAAMARMLS